MQLFIAAFSRDQQRRCLSARTIHGRQKTLESLHRWLDEHDRAVTACEAEDVHAWLDSCALGTRSRATYLSTVRMFFRFCVEGELLPLSPVDQIRSPRTTRLVPRPVADSDLVVALEAADARMRAWLCLGAYEGLRTVEMATLVRSDIMDASADKLVLVREGKGRHQRIVPLHPDAESALRLYGLPSRGHLFRKANGQPMREQTIGAYIGRHFRSLGVQSSAHQLRHWFGTHVYAQTHDIRLTQELLGHASPTTTAMYAAYSDAEAVAAVRSLTPMRSDGAVSLRPGPRPTSEQAGDGVA